MTKKNKIIYILTILLIWYLFGTGAYAIEVEQVAEVAVPIKEERVQSESSVLADKRLMASSSYDMRNDITIRVKNQKSSSSCWTFSTLNVLETNLALTQKDYIDFSERHMNYSTSKTFLDGINPLGYEREVNNGGNPIIGLSYMTRGSGPILEENMKFSEVEDKINLADIDGKKVEKKIEEYVMFPSINKVKQVNGALVYQLGNTNQTYTKEQVLQVRKQIKEHIMKYGGLTAMTLSGSGYSKYYNYNLEYPAYYCDDASLEPNHQVTIIGWDDNYPVSNFNAEHRPSEPGAYLVLNSYGTGGSYPQGCYYISYEDTMIENCLVGITKVSNVDYDNIYQSDPLGPSTQISIEDATTIYGANVFTRSCNKFEQINQISIASMEEMDCEVYINPVDGDLTSNKLQKVSSIVSVKAGYTTIKWDEPVNLTGEKFVVVVKFTNEEIVRVTAEAPSSEFWATATSQKGESFVSTNLVNWIDLSDTNIKNANLCIKAFTEEIDNDIMSNEYKINGDTHSILGIRPNVTYTKVLLNNISTTSEVKIYNKSNQEIGANEKIATGMRLVLNNNTSYDLFVNGDISGNGMIDLLDLSQIKYSIIDEVNLDSLSMKAADVNQDGNITISDMVLIIQDIIGLKKL